eukprot:CAMPEP_0181380400 /NCGR_PEP_ID=MMETSP1106-20121128/19529_1 /TAXON_ID=81844 /ORGANISM="Mantoniella antarctica, Strain SL-175" /LENGTH=218 /DNA_ID=CAMNT_0023499437 /DNA_START=468 /DNA_END=1121 /DNA_ORIENTATION=+
MADASDRQATHAQATTTSGMGGGSSEAVVAGAAEEGEEYDDGGGGLNGGGGGGVGGGDGDSGGERGSLVTGTATETDPGTGAGSGGGPGPSGGPGGAGKKARLVWTPELHMRFMNAVNHLGIKNAVPKTILQLMNVEGMTRENVASHLQKYRLYLKRLAGVPPNAPLPPDIMQRAQPYHYPGTPMGASGGMGGRGASGAFMPTMEQMHAGIPPDIGHF